MAAEDSHHLKSDTPIRPRHFRAPQRDGEVLIEPDLSEAGQMVAENRYDQVDSQLRIFNESHAQIAENCRFELVRAALEYSQAYRDFSPQHRSFFSDTPIVLAGHQPTLFHPGVWLKNFVLDECRKIPNEVQTIQIPKHPTPTLAINLVIDNDVAGNASIRIPTGSPSRPHAEEFAIDEPFANVPFEDRPIVSSSMVKGFSARLVKQLQPRRWFERNPSPALLAGRLAEYFEVPWQGKADRPLGESLARARHRLEQDLGLQTLELPLSHITRTASFRVFAIHLWRNLPRLQEIYNRSLAEYRIVNKIRSSSHPVPALVAETLSIPELTVSGEWLEAPFWIWSKDDPRRRRLFIRHDRNGDSLSTVAFTDRNKIATSIMGPNDDLAPWLELWRCVEEMQGIKIRPRALITTMYARLFLSDLFIHGIGGAKYDELTDAIIRRFFGIEPPAYMTVTGTVRLPIPRPATTEADVRNVKQLIREIRFHPERFVNDASPAVRESAAHFAAQKQELLRQHQFHFRHASREEFRALDDLNQRLATLLTDVEIRLRDELHDREREVHAAKILGNREFSFVLHPADELPEQLKRMAASS